ncbi:MAG: glycoside hydrolase family 3 N-terminal domain-containing protein [Cytophagaceae bacterium]
MKKLLSALLITLFTVSLFSCKDEKNQTPKSSLNPDVEKKIDDLLAKMTIEEKVGQMTQITLDIICKGAPFDENKKMELDPAKLDTALIKYKVGSILNTGTSTLSREEWNTIVGMIQDVAAKKTDKKIPVLYGIDAIHGATYTKGATMFPQELCLAATWDPSFAEKTGSVTAYEVRASAIPWNFSPVLDLGRQPLWSRFFETFGEDPYLATEMGKAMVKGYQGNNVGDPEKVAACLKHYMGYSFSFTGKDRTPILMPERLLREYYLPPFAEAIKGGAQTVMINSSEINGTPVHASKLILTDILKGELNFQGFAVTDWEDIVMLHTVHRTASSHKEAVKQAVLAGVDMSMTPMTYTFATDLVQLVKDKEVPMERINDAVRRILRVKFNLGLFDKPFYEMNRYPKFGSDEFAQMSYEAALESITLLKNQDSILPLSKTKKILVTGAGAHSLNALNGAWTHTWQGVEPKYNTPGKKTVYEAIKDKVGEQNVKYMEGTSYDKDVNTLQAVWEARNVDYILVCISEKPSAEKPGDIEDLTLDEAQLNLISALSKTGKPVILVLLESRPRIFTKVEGETKAVIMGYRPGNEGGRALAELLYGDVNPSGKLPFTYPRYTGSLVTYDHKTSETRDKDFGNNAFNPLYQFGAGLSYTTYSYSDLQTSADTLKGLETLTVKVKVTNTGKVAGKEVVHLFVRDEYATITPSVKRLRGFKKIALNPGETKEVSFTLGKDNLGFVNNSNKWVTETGVFKIMAGNQWKDFWYSEK